MNQASTFDNKTFVIDDDDDDDDVACNDYHNVSVLYRFIVKVEQACCQWYEQAAQQVLYVINCWYIGCFHLSATGYNDRAGGWLAPTQHVSTDANQAMADKGHRLNSSVSDTLSI